MITLYLRYRNLTTDLWTEVPSLTSSFPSTVVGALPALSATIETAPQIESLCGCSDTSMSDTYLVTKVECPRMPASLTDTVLLFLLNFKTAAFHEIKMQHFGAGHYVTAELSLLHCE